MRHGVHPVLPNYGRTCASSGCSRACISCSAAASSAAPHSRTATPTGAPSATGAGCSPVEVGVMSNEQGATNMIRSGVRHCLYRQQPALPRLYVDLTWSVRPTRAV
jgi:hypothetical protein